ncbi:MAG TPA: hypothetical protein VJU58_03975 [Microbacterium sp.]|nr:hypothetical protein [Microbacterium sp.]
MSRVYSHFATQDEAIAAALVDAAPGEVVEVHMTACGIVEDPETGEVLKPCTCEPMSLTVGASA